MLRNSYLQCSPSKLAEVCLRSVQFCIGTKGRLLRGGDRGAGYGSMRGSPGRYRGTEDIPGRKESCAMRVQQAVEGH